MHLSESVSFRETHRTVKTTVNVVELLPHNSLLGEVRWFIAWRRYAFFPHAGCPLPLDENHLHTIATFCNSKTKEHYDGRRARS